MNVSLFFKKYLIIVSLIASMHVDGSNDQQKLILIGAGGQQGIEYFHLLKNNINFVGFVQPNPKENILLIADEYQIPLYQDLEDLCKDINFDGAIITVPHHLHFEYTNKLIALNKFIIKEKPIAITTDEVVSYKNSMNGQIPPILVIVQRQFKEPFLQAQLDFATLGKISSFNYYYTLNYQNESTGWRANKELSGGGAVLDMGYHVVDILTTFFDMPMNAQVEFEYKSDAMKEKDLENGATISLTYASGLTGFVFISRSGVQKKEIFEVNGDNGKMIITSNSYDLYDKEGNLVKNCATISKEDELRNMFTAYLAHCKDDSYITNQFLRHEKNMQFIDMIYSQK